MSWKGSDDLRPMLRPLEGVALDPQNARVHTRRNLDAIKLSLATFGQRKPIVVREGVALAGNGTIAAARELGWTEIALVQADDLTREQAIAYALADNKTGDLAEWDLQELGVVLRALPKGLHDATGFQRFERDPLMQEEWSPPAIDDATTVHQHVDMVSLAASPEEGEVIRAAVAKVKAAEQQDFTEGRALELICADYLS